MTSPDFRPAPDGLGRDLLAIALLVVGVAALLWLAYTESTRLGIGATSVLSIIAGATLGYRR